MRGSCLHSVEAITTYGSSTKPLSKIRDAFETSGARGGCEGFEMSLKYRL